MHAAPDTDPPPPGGWRYDQPLGQAEGAFLLCGFAMCLAQLAAGNLVEHSAGSSGSAPRAAQPAYWPRNSTSDNGN